MAIGPGLIVKVYDDEVNPPKSKYWLILGISGADVGIVYINSEPRYNPKCAGYQYKIMPDERGLVEKECYANCAEIKDKSLEFLQSQIARSKSVVRGNLTDLEFSTVRDLLNSAGTIPKSDLRKYGLV